MATYGSLKGNAKNAPKAVEPNEKPDRQHRADFKALLDGKREITVRANENIGLLGYAPGDDMDAEPHMVAIPIGGIARIIKEGDKSWNQPAAVLANFLARGRIAIVPDKEFDKAEAHKAIAVRNREAELARQAERAGGDLGDVGATLIGQAEMIRQMQAKIAKLEGAKAA